MYDYTHTPAIYALVQSDPAFEREIEKRMKKISRADSKNRIAD